MTISSPDENIYYYECSNGQFRLTYFMPPSELKRLCDKKKISIQVLEDHPDGVDLGCTEPDFSEFEETYDYRPPIDPEILCRTFFAIFSTTRDWKKFRGSGFIPAADLERHVEEIEGTLLERKIKREDFKLPKEALSPEQYRKRRQRQISLQKNVYNALQKFPVKGIDPEHTLHQQKFSKIKRIKGIGAEKVFIRLHQKKRKED